MYWDSVGRFVNPASVLHCNSKLVSSSYVSSPLQRSCWVGCIYGGTPSCAFQTPRTSLGGTLWTSRTSTASCMNYRLGPLNVSSWLTDWNIEYPTGQYRKRNFTCFQCEKTVHKDCTHIQKQIYIKWSNSQTPTESSRHIMSRHVLATLWLKYLLNYWTDWYEILKYWLQKFMVPWGWILLNLVIPWLFWECRLNSNLLQIFKVSMDK